MAAKWLVVRGAGCALLCQRSESVLLLSACCVSLLGVPSEQGNESQAERPEYEPRGASQILACQAVPEASMLLAVWTLQVWLTCMGLVQACC